MTADLLPMFDASLNEVGTAVLDDDDHGVVFLTIPAVVVEDNQQ